MQAASGTTLRTALLTGGVTPHNGRATLINCRGLGTCGTCAVEVVGPVQPQEWTAQEQLRLNFPPHGPQGNRRLRLACQVLPATCSGPSMCCLQSCSLPSAEATLCPLLCAGGVLRR